METAESLKNRIHTAQELHGLVRTMKAMAAVNIRHLEKAVISLADYQRTIELALRVVLKRNPRVAVAAQRCPSSADGGSGVRLRPGDVWPAERPHRSICRFDSGRG